jgi:hypothetical protein
LARRLYDAKDRGASILGVTDYAALADTAFANLELRLDKRYRYTAVRKKRGYLR